ncbi:MAG: aldehyde dehydrogenase family protein [Acidimicrobiia bacterium]
MTTTTHQLGDVRPMFVGGEWRQASNGGAMPTFNPATEEQMAEVAAGTAADVDLAVAAANEAAPHWGGRPWTERANILRQVAARIRDNVEQVAIVDVDNAGLPITTARVDALRAADEIDYYAGIAGETKGTTSPTQSDVVSYTLREPYGIVGRIIPFNHPFNFSAAKIAAPLAAGNTVILKAPDQTPLPALAFAELVEDLLPPGVLSVLTGHGAEAGAAIASHPEIPRVAFIGSVETGRAVMRAGAEHIKHVTLELGGKNPMIICEDMDPKTAAVEAVNGMNMRKTMGQSCQSNSRVFVHESLADEFLEHLATICNSLIVDDPRAEDTEMGPLGYPGHYERVLGHIDNAIEDGARLICGGSRPAHLDRGCYVAPTVLADVNPGMRIFGQEVFGPVMAVIPWSDEATMLEQVNSIDLGLTARIWTGDAKRANRLVAGVQSGLIWVNGNKGKSRGLPFGGFKLSGLGKEGCLEELVSYTREKAVMSFF